MTTFNWPTADWGKPASGEWRVVDNLQRNNESPLSGHVQTLSMPGARWGWMLDFNHQPLADREQLEGFLLGLSGREHRVFLWDFKRPRPRGTLNTTGVTTSGSTAQFATTMTLTGCGISKTLLAGDWFATPTQLLRCVQDTTSNGAGAMTVNFRHMLRATVAGGAAITLIQPTAAYIRTEAGLAAPRDRGLLGRPMSLDFVEAF